MNKVVLVTGGTGSFGKTMVTKLLAEGYPEIRILSRDEAKQEEMRISYSRPELKFYIGDVRDRAAVDKAMKGVDLVFHAAALKQVPSCEFFPMEAVKTNIIGSQNVIDSAVDAGVKSLVCLSTDKAVMPVNAMGMSKAMMEKVAQASSRQLGDNDTVISCVRYGNVMCSRGSVIPLFIKQIKEGKTLTLTEPTMTRFMLSLNDAIELVAFAFENASQGDIFIKKAPACTVQLLAETLLDIFEASNEIRVIGWRHGEKLYETLASAEELLRSDDMGEYYRVSYDNRDLNYAKFFTEGDVEEASTEDYHSHNTYQLSKEELKDLLLTLPEVQEALNG
ncbi:UDP-glucose 4-epimerase [Alcanivorax sp. HI0083]|uniref:SDR family NAD(P)-dependent oxidoreductase n=1 Tax=unclassified Alcanivorax TaxID=2638842 RepID=UPI0007BAD804|nr:MULTISPECIES: SDR family NAD(P)-dependent oxidoreductase [unclassified Alcanivorax]KZY35103.1 UDP-glucose 4-epimerase [Alcanivorax sp. HI0044]KZZ27122.1 UDP-glucose 4-epimerase [Alcanivorax sp. HI0083]